MPPYPSVPSPATYADGPLVVSELRDDVTSGVLYLSNRPSFSAYCTGTPVIPSGAYTAVVLDTEYSDPWQGHSPLGSDPQNYYCQSPGWYLAEGFVPWTYTGATILQFGCGLGVNTASGLVTSNGQFHFENSGQNPGVFVSDLVHLQRTGAPGSASADYVQLQAFTSGSGLSLQGSSPNVPRLSLRWMGTGASSSLAVPANAAWPVPPSYITTTWLNANIRDAVTFLSDPPMLRRVRNPSASDFPSTTWPSGTTFALTTPSLDNYGAYSSGQWTVPQPGVYYVSCQAGTLGSGGAARYAAGVSVNGTITWGNAILSASGALGTVITSFADRFRLAAGDTVALAAFQDSGSDLQTTADMRMIIAWEAS